MWSSPQFSPGSEHHDASSTPSASWRIPPPPVEVIIRTMESDIASLAASGGNKIRPEVLRMIAGVTQAQAPTSSGLPGKKTPIGTIVVIFLGALILLAAIYFSFFY